MAQVSKVEPDELSPALRTKVDEIRAHLQRATPREALERYKIGVAIRDIDSDRRKYGQSAVAKVARALGFNEDTLYLYASVARTWKERDFEELASRKGERTKLPLAFSHFVVLATVEDARTRAALAEEALTRGLAVRQLRALAQLAEASGRRSAPYPFLASIVKTSKSLSDRRESWRAQLAKLTEEEPSARLVKALESAHEAQLEMAEESRQDAKLIESTLRRVRSTLATK